MKINPGTASRDPDVASTSGKVTDVDFGENWRKNLGTRSNWMLR